VASVLSGLLHDAGKATRWFQDRLDGETDRRDERGNHSRFSALLAHHFFQAGEVRHPDRDWLHWTTVLGIAKHHGNFDRGLKTLFTDLRAHLNDSAAIRDQLDEFDGDGFQSWLEDELDEFGIDADAPAFDPDQVLTSIEDYYPKFDRDSRFTEPEEGFDFLAAFGAFVGADKMDTVFRERQRDAPELSPEIVDTYKRSEFGEPDNYLDEQREAIFAEVQETLDAEDENWIYTLTAPTGSGKTLTGLAAGLRLKERQEQDDGDSRLIYCLPFTSVIDQNSKVYERVLESGGIDDVDDRLLLKHHHLADPRYREGDEPIVDGGELLVESWDSEIIVTTFHQFVHTIFTCENKNLKRFSALRNAVVILDEVQAVDHEYWGDLRRAMQLCADRLGTTFLLMTATMPLIVDPQETPELLETHPRRYEELAKTRLVPRLEEPMTVEELASETRSAIEAGKHRRILIVNRRDTARRLYRRLENLPVPTAMLSRDLTPLDREGVIDDLGLEESEASDPFVLVSTQVIEAGVDVSSDVLVREIAPLDSIIQSAGRCNREFELDPDLGRVEVVNLEEDGSGLAVPPYSDFLIQSTLEVLQEFGKKAPIKEARVHEMARRYYALLQTRGASGSVTDLLGQGAIHKLDDYDEGLRLIDDRRPEQSHYIIQTGEDRRIWQEYLEIQNMEIHSKADLREKKRRFQNIKRDFSKRLVNYPSDGEPEREVLVVEPDNGAYHSKMGLLRNLAGDSYGIIG
jgi:CRISPR-associated endonuclease/helicase Cas3